jgi:hypothetical protein
VNRESLSGQRFVRWQVIRSAGSNAQGRRLYTCLCDCGTLRAVEAISLRGGRSQSCGCLRRELAAKNRIHANNAAKQRAWEKFHPTGYQRKRNPESARRRSNKWRKAHPDAARAAVHRRKARTLGNGGSWTAAEWQTLKRQLGFRCVGCWKHESELKVLGRKLVPDHIIPLSQGGLNHITNLQPLCHGRGGCNNTKGASYADFLVS